MCGFSGTGAGAALYMGEVGEYMAACRSSFEAEVRGTALAISLVRKCGRSCELGGR